MSIVYKRWHTTSHKFAPQNTQIVPRSGMKLMMHQFFIATERSLAG